MTQSTTTPTEHERALKSLHRLETALSDLHHDWPAIADYAEAGAGQYDQVENVSYTLGDLTTLRSYVRELIGGMTSHPAQRRAAERGRSTEAE